MCLMLSALTPAPASSPVPQAAPVDAITSTGQVLDATARGETRLRKLHLVRPDLIPYPIAFEVYC